MEKGRWKVLEQQHSAAIAALYHFPFTLFHNKRKRK
jgi:hypothetical protein